MNNMFGKKKKNKKNEQFEEESFALDDESMVLTEDNNLKGKQVLGKGERTMFDFLAPDSIDRSDETFIKIGNKYVRNFTIQGYPSHVYVTWLRDFYQYDGDMDVAVYAEPADDRDALEELTKKITAYEAQLQTELEKGSNREISMLRNKIETLYQEREKIELNMESLFYVSISCNLYADSKEQLDRETKALDNRVAGKKITLVPSYLRMDDGYKSCLPYGNVYINDKFRNFNTAGLGACFPFYNSELTHLDGLFCGINLETKTPMYVNFYDKKILNNANITVFGASGSGKTFFVSLLTMRSAIQGIKTVIIDPEGEYVKLTEALGGVHIYIAPDSNNFINPFDIEEEVEIDADGRITGNKIVDIKTKATDILNLISVMTGGLDATQLALCSTAITQLYKKFGITSNPESLYTNEPFFDEKTGRLYTEGMKKRMPQFSDFYNMLKLMIEKDKKENLRPLLDSLKIFKKGGIYDMFDCQSTVESSRFATAPVITFDVSRLEENILRPIGMYIALSWTMEKFIKKNPEILKRVICDEAWMLVNKNMAGNEYTSAFLNNAARRIRKRNGGLLIASQNFVEFAENSEAQSILQNSAVNIFLKQNETDIDRLQEKFKLSDGEKNYLTTCPRGNFLIKMNGESATGYAYGFDFERSLIEKAKVHKD